MPALPLVLAVVCLLHLFALVQTAQAASDVPRDAPDGEVLVDWSRADAGGQGVSLLKREHLPEYFAAEVSELFHLPADLSLVVAPCGSRLPDVPAGGRSLYLCTESVDLFDRVAARVSGSPGAAGDLVLDASLYALYMELGRILPETFGLPATARGPEAARRLGLWSLLQCLGAPDEHGLASALNAADFFANAVTSEDLAPPERPFWQACALTPAAYEDILCLIVGFDPEQTEQVLGAGPDEILPPSRANGCAAAYDRLDAQAVSLLGPAFRPEPGTAAAPEVAPR